MRQRANFDTSRLSRRQALRALGGLGATALLAACGGTPAMTATMGGNPTAAPATAPPATVPVGPAAGSTVTRAAGPSTATRSAGAATANAATVKITIPPSGADFPSGQLALRVTVLGPGPRSPFYKEFFAAYRSARPNVTVAFDELPADQLNQAISLAIQNNTAPDIFSLPTVVTGGQAVQQGWVAPVDDQIPNFAAWKAAFPPGVFAEGITMFGGKVYAVPLSSNQRYSTMIIYNPDLLQRAGYDPATTPFTWDTFRVACQKITQQGAGKYYGLILGGKAPDDNTAALVTNFAQMAGAAGGQIDWRTGQYNYASDQFLAATELLLAINKDGSILPGALSLGQRDATTRLAQGTAGMTFDGPWAPTRWAEKFSYGVASQPLPNTGTPLPLTYMPGGANQHWLSAKSRNPAVAGDIFSYWGSAAGQAAFQGLVGSALQALLPEARQAAGSDPLLQTMNTLFTDQMRLAPDPRVRNPDVGQVYAEQRPIHPDLGEMMGGLLAGQLRDPKAALQDLQDRAEAELARALKAAQAKGAKVSRDDWKFANWDPTRDYTETDYKAR